MRRKFPGEIPPESAFFEFQCDHGGGVEFHLRKRSRKGDLVSGRIKQTPRCGIHRQDVMKNRFGHKKILLLLLSGGSLPDVHNRRFLSTFEEDQRPIFFQTGSSSTT